MKRISGRERPLTNRMRQVITLKVEQPGISNAAMGKLLGISGQRVGKILSSDRLQRALLPATKRLLSASVPQAGQTLISLMNQNKNLEVKRKVAERILDSNQVLEPETHVIKHELELLGVEDLASRVRDAIKISAPTVIDAEIVEEE